MKRKVGAIGVAALLGLAVAACVDSGPGSDFDNDGVKDTIEDENDNFMFDPGELDFLNPDTDLDGLCDGQPTRVLANCTGCEDCNNDGFWEPCLGENDPLNDDTDADGVRDRDDPQLDTARVGIDCSAGSPRLPYGTSLGDKPFPARPTPTSTPAPFPTSTPGPPPTLPPDFFTPQPTPTP
ncbi:MAG: hypothetical protein ACREQQ_01985 [Candidatus Binatia bacterium]